MPSFSDIYAAWGLPNLGPQGKSTGNHVLNSLKGSFWEYFSNQSDAAKRHRFEETVKGVNNWITSGNLRGENYVGQAVTVPLPSRPIQLPTSRQTAPASPAAYVSPPSSFGYGSLAPSPVPSFSLLPPPKHASYPPPSARPASTPGVPTLPSAPNVPTTTNAIQTLTNASNTQLWGGTLPLPKATAGAATPVASPTAIDSLVKSKGLGSFWDFRKPILKR